MIDMTNPLPPRRASQSLEPVMTELWRHVKPWTADQWASIERRALEARRARAAARSATTSWQRSYLLAFARRVEAELRAFALYLVCDLKD